MPHKPSRPASDIEALADDLRAHRQQGEAVHPWMRRNVGRLTRLVHQRGWRLEDIGRAMTLAGITFASGKPWSEQLVAVKMSQARAHLRARKGTRGDPRDDSAEVIARPAPIQTGGAQQLMPAPGQGELAPPATAVASEADIPPAPRFKLATLRGAASAAPPVESRPSPAPAPQPPMRDEAQVDEAIAAALGRPSPPSRK